MLILEQSFPVNIDSPAILAGMEKGRYREQTHIKRKPQLTLSDWRWRRSRI